MSVATRLKIALALIGVLVFAAGIRLDQSRLRLIGIGFVAVAWLMRFARSRAPDDVSAPDA